MHIMHQHVICCQQILYWLATREKCKGFSNRQYFLSSCRPHQLHQFFFFMGFFLQNKRLWYTVALFIYLVENCSFILKKKKRRKEKSVYFCFPEEAFENDRKQHPMWLSGLKRKNYFSHAWYFIIKQRW